MNGESFSSPIMWLVIGGLLVMVWMWWNQGGGSTS